MATTSSHSVPVAAAVALILGAPFYPTMVAPAFAQSNNPYCPNVTATPCLQAKQNENFRTFQIGWENPWSCDDEIVAAAAAWSNAGSRFRTTQDSAYWNGPRAPGTPKYQITFQPSADFYNTTALAEAPYGQSVAGLHIDGKYIPVVDDSDIMVNRDLWASNSFDCDDTAPANGRYDLALILAHEFGHVVGQNHVTLTSCATYQFGLSNVAFVGLCLAERDAAIRLYGAQ